MPDLKDLVYSLNRLCEFLRDEYNINRGGCCYVSYCIAKHLDKLKIKYQLVIKDDCARDLNFVINQVTNRKYTSDLNSVIGYNTCNHYCIYIENGGVVNNLGYYDNEFMIPEITASNILWIYKNGDWNPEYDTYYNSIIKEFIKIFFKRYE